MAAPEGCPVIPEDDIVVDRTESGLLGNGSLGEVRRAILRGEPVAVKSLFTLMGGNAYQDMTPAERAAQVRDFSRECATLLRAAHQNVVRLIGIVIVDDVPRYLVTELLPMSLERLLRRGGLTLDRKLAILLDIACGLVFFQTGLHVLMHRDLKPANVLIDGEGRAKIADMGCARWMSPGTFDSRSLQGTPLYMAPEMRDGPDAGKTAAVDIFSFGVMMVEVDSQRPPRPTTDTIPNPAIPGNRIVVPEMRRRKADLEAAPTVALRALAIECLSDDPKLRPSAARCYSQLELLRDLATTREEVAVLRGTLQTSEERQAAELASMRAVIAQADEERRAIVSRLEQSDARLREVEERHVAQIEALERRFATLALVQMQVAVPSAPPRAPGLPNFLAPLVRVCGREHFEGGYKPKCTAEHIFVPSVDVRGVAVLTRGGDFIRHIGDPRRHVGKYFRVVRPCFGVAILGDMIVVAVAGERELRECNSNDGMPARFYRAGAAPVAVAASEDHVFVLTTSDNVETFGPNGTKVRAINVEGNGVDVAVCDNEMYVLTENCVSVFSTLTGERARVMALLKDYDYHGICASRGLVFLLVRETVVVRSAVTGERMATLSREGMTRPKGVCISDDGVLYVTCDEGIVSFRIFEA